MSLDRFVEYYIACNPPLEPHGVKSAIDVAKRALREGDQLEVLYEPEVPWFKCISSVLHRATVTSALQDYLVGVMEAETSLVGLAFRPKEADFYSLPKDDVYLVVDNPRVIPWKNYKKNVHPPWDSYEAYRYPEPILRQKYKAVWRGIEKRGDWNVDDVFVRLAAIETDTRIPRSLEELELWIGCYVTHNLRGDTIYIGADEEKNVKEAPRKLERLLGYLDAYHEDSDEEDTKARALPAKFDHEDLISFDTPDNSSSAPSLSTGESSQTQQQFGFDLPLRPPPQESPKTHYGRGRRKPKEVVFW